MICGQHGFKNSGSPLTFLSSVEERSVLWRVSDLNDLRSGQQLHDKARGDDRRDPQLHQGTWRESLVRTAAGQWLIL